jgi:hypothetical protein
MRVAELKLYCDQFVEVAERTKALISGLSEAQFNWRPGPEQWSIEECLGHLVITGQRHLKLIEQGIAKGRARGFTGKGPFRYGFLERVLLRQMEPPVRRRFSAPRRLRPVHGQPLSAIVPTFLHLQSQFTRVAEESEGLDLGRIKVPSPAFHFWRTSLGVALALAAAHERRHVEQAWRVRRDPQFPGRS